MATIASIAREFNAQPYEIAAFADRGTDYSDDAQLDESTETMIREALAIQGEIDADR